jgi:hypothetical protein
MATNYRDRRFKRTNTYFKYVKRKRGLKMYEYSGIHSDLQEIKNELKKESKEDKIEKLERENFKLKNQICELLSLNKKILREIVSKHYMFAVPITKSDVRMYTSENVESFECKVVNIPLDKKVIELFNTELFNILHKY